MERHGENSRYILSSKGDHEKSKRYLRGAKPNGVVFSSSERKKC
jgi:hypothetical protein